jgi:hypothetical protein
MEPRTLTRADLIQAAKPIIESYSHKTDKFESKLIELLGHIGRHLFSQFDFVAARQDSNQFKQQKEKYIQAADRLVLLLLEILVAQRDEKSFIKMLQAFVKMLDAATQANDFFTAKTITLMFGMLPDNLLAKLAQKQKEKVQQYIRDYAKPENQFDQAVLLANSARTVEFHLADFFFKVEFIRSGTELKRNQSKRALDRHSSKKNKLSEEMLTPRENSEVDNYYNMFERMLEMPKKRDESHAIENVILIALSLPVAANQPVLKDSYDSMLRFHHFVFALSHIKNKQTSSMCDTLIAILQDDLNEADRLQQIRGIERYIECENNQSPGLLKKFSLIRQIKQAIQDRIYIENFIQQTSRKSQDAAAEENIARLSTAQSKPKKLKSKKTETKLKRIKSSSSIMVNPGSGSAVHLLDDDAIDNQGSLPKRKRANTNEQQITPTTLLVRKQPMLDPLDEELPLSGSDSESKEIASPNAFERKKQAHSLVPVLSLFKIPSANPDLVSPSDRKMSPSKSSPAVSAHSREQDSSLSSGRSITTKTPREPGSVSARKSPRSVQSDSSLHTPRSITPRAEIDTPRTVQALRSIFSEQKSIHSPRPVNPDIEVGKTSKIVSTRVLEFEKLVTSSSGGQIKPNASSQSQPTLSSRPRGGSVPEHLDNANAIPQRRNTFDTTRNKKGK